MRLPRYSPLSRVTAAPTVCLALACGVQPLTTGASLLRATEQQAADDALSSAATIASDSHARACMQVVSTRPSAGACYEHEHKSSSFCPLLTGALVVASQADPRKSRSRPDLLAALVAREAQVRALLCRSALNSARVGFTPAALMRRCSPQRHRLGWSGEA